MEYNNFVVKLLSIISLILVLVLFPPAALALISNNAVPGQATYPIKRGLEDVIYAVASLNSTTKAWFSAARSDRRFTEVKTLLAQGKVADQSLQELVTQTQTAAIQISEVQDPVRKQELINNLSESIQKYNQGLTQADQPTAQPIAQVSPTQPPVTQVTNPNVPTARPISTQTPVGTRAPAIVQTPAPTPVPTPIPVVPTQPDQINKTIDELKKIADQLKTKKSEEHIRENKEEDKSKKQDSQNNSDKGKREGKN